MKKHNKAIRFAASLFAVSLIVSACGGDDAATEDTAATEEPAAEPVSYPTLAECADVSYDYTFTAPASAGMTVIGYVVLPVAVANCVGFLTQLAHVIAIGQNSRIRS
jgi:hypothetical protein